MRTFLILLFLSCSAFSEELIDPTPEEYENIKRWIPQTCCWTNNCCKKVSPSALRLLSNKKVEVVSTKQVLDLTGWSRDNNTWRCTCDYKNGEWVVSPSADTRCVFPQPNAGY